MSNESEVIVVKYIFVRCGQINQRKKKGIKTKLTILS